MHCTIKHSCARRLRFQLPNKLTEHEAVALEEIFMEMPEVTKAVAYPKAGSFAVELGESVDARLCVLRCMHELTQRDLDDWQPTDVFALAPRSRHLFAQIANATAWFLIRLFVVPNPFKTVWWLWCALPFWRRGLQALRQGRLDVDVLDASAIALGFTQGANNAGETMYLLKMGEMLEDYTQKRAQTSLAESLLGLPTTARVVSGNEEIEKELHEVAEGDVIVVRMGLDIPVDGKVISGEALVNQASLTGESTAILRHEGDTVYAGTTVEEGEIFIRIEGDPEESKLRSVIAMISEPDAAKSNEQKHMEAMANKLVPWNFALAGAVALFSRSLTKTASVLMVDYSCALRMSAAIAVMAAQREGAQLGFMVKGSRFFKAFQEADAIVFDKTGTLTEATLKVCHVEPFDGYTREEALRLAACLEEHFPHPVARAVVQAAYDEGLEHREDHAAVEYIVAHGIASALDGKRVVIGSQHFVLEDEGVSVSAEQLEHIHSLSPGASSLFLAVDGELVGVIFVEDVVRDNASAVVDELRAEGFERIVMLTGDEEHAAKRVADQVGIDDLKWGLLPEDKCDCIRALQAEGYKVCMIGDGVNDSPALALADVSIAMSAGSAVAREAADITLTSNDLEALIHLRHLADALDRRMKQGYNFTLAFNSVLLALGIGGILTPQQSAFLHNGSTIALSVANSQRYSTI